RGLYPRAGGSDRHRYSLWPACPALSGTEQHRETIPGGKHSHATRLSRCCCQRLAAAAGRMPENIDDASVGTVMVEVRAIPRIEELSPGADEAVYDLAVYVAGYEERSAWFVNSNWCPRISADRWRRVEFAED